MDFYNEEKFKKWKNILTVTALGLLTVLLFFKVYVYFEKSVQIITGTLFPFILSFVIVYSLMPFIYIFYIRNTCIHTVSSGTTVKPYRVFYKKSGKSSEKSDFFYGTK